MIARAETLSGHTFFRPSPPISARVPAVYETRVHQTISTIDRDAWDALYEGELERYDYLRAVEQARLPGFDWFYLTIHRSGRLAAAAPCFLTTYSLETTLNDFARGLISRIRRRFPDAFHLRLAAIGSPCTETAMMQISKDLNARDRQLVSSLFVKALRLEAARRHAGLIAVKDLPASQSDECASALKDAGFGATPGMPGACLNIDFPNVDSYLARLSASARKDMRRKLRAAAAIRIERRTSINDVRDEVLALYRETLARADLTFEELTAEYFEGVLRTEDCRPSCVLYFKNDRLLAANLLLENDAMLLDKFFCMAPEGRRLNLYFVSWFENIRYCLDRGIGTYYSGQAGYKNKVRLGSALKPTTLYFRHRNPIINLGLRAAAPFFSGDLES